MRPSLPLSFSFSVSSSASFFLLWTGEGDPQRSADQQDGARARVQVAEGQEEEGPEERGEIGLDSHSYLFSRNQS